MPDLPEHVQNRRNPARGARDSSLKALERFQAHSVSKTVGLEVSDPKTRKQALESSHREQWLEAEREELKSLYEMKVWEIVPRTPEMNVLGCRFVYKTKRKPDRSIERWKCRLVAQGFKQQEGIDYNETFASTVNMQSVRIFFWLVVRFDLELFKIDIKTFFLYGVLDETLYMEQPKGYEEKPRDMYVCKLIKSLYGTKQGMRCANKHLDTKLRLIGMTQIISDNYVYLYRKDSSFIVLCNFVDDIACAASSVELGRWFVRELRRHYVVTAEYNPSVYLSFEITRNRKKKFLKISQKGYIQGLAKDFKIDQENPRPVPFAPCTLPQLDEVVVEDVPYQMLVGSLIWCLKTRPDVSVHVGLLCRYMSRYNKMLYGLALKVLIYLFHILLTMV